MSAKINFIPTVWVMWLFLLHCSTSIYAKTEPRLKNVLNGKHLRVVWPNWIGNPPGLSGPLKGKVILDYLVARFNFTSHFVRVTENWFEPTANGSRGQFTYLWNNEADLLLVGALPTSDRLKTVDLTTGYLYDAVSILIPVSDDVSSNAAAVIKPFQWPVWLSLILSTAIVAFVFKRVQSLILRDLTDKTPSHTSKRQLNQMKLTNPYLYIFGNILSQGNDTFFTCPSPTIHRNPYENHDLADNADVNILARKLGPIETMIMTSNSSEFLMKLKAKMDKTGCVLAADCVRQVKTGSKNVLLETKVFQIDHIKNRFERTRKCDIQIVDYGMFNVIPCLALQKNSPYTSPINKGLTELREIGVIDFWDSWFRPIPRQCSANVKGLAEKEANKHSKKLSRLSLKNLTGAFTVLLIGFALSFIAFLYEHFSALIAVRKQT